MKERRRNDREIALLTKSIVSYESFSASGRKEEIVQLFKHIISGRKASIRNANDNRSIDGISESHYVIALVFFHSYTRSY